MTHSTSAIVQHPDRLFIGGEWVTPHGNGRLDVFDSSTEELFVSVCEADDTDIERAVHAARTAFDDGPWPMLSHAERARYLSAIADEIEARHEDLATIWTAESGVIQSIANPASRMLADTWRYHAELAATFPFVERAQPGRGSGNVGLIVREPVGVVAAIVPWNAPASMVTNKCAPALLAGCTVIVKASPEAPSASYLFAEICEKIGLPPGVVNVVAADRGASESLVRNPGVDKVTITGSTAAGRKVGAICGERIARCTLELGGKSPGLILDDYDIATAATTIAQKATFITGQVCSSLTRLIVTRSRHDDLVEALCDEFSRVTVGDPYTEGTQMGPLASSAQLQRVQGYIAKGQSEGARLMCGGGRPSGLNRGYYIEPTVFGQVDNGYTIARDEIFGPVLSVIAADDENHAIKIANDTIYGLNASVFTHDVDKAYAIARKLRSGTVGHNSFRTDLSIAFGGFKASGIGREGGTEGLLPYLETKTVLLDELPSHLALQGAGHDA
ncbi:aldehyde dehydrogenase [Sphingomonas sp. Root710]|uniref:aldehyde dehydrogenase n=1 Tax=Sphingomonas sp. Root710 TaxID=1736594 RepID=UPI0006F2E3B5|nr:aldehyde dehydrogenase [Sphingomonas sp. Root710]KRB82991.1 aldehyde dehydrogenase [Sphingomonas sp. Root710]